MLAVQLGSTGHELSRLLPGLAERVAHLRPPTPAQPETERWLLFEATAQFVQAVATDRLLLLIIDDLHWAEPATLLLLRHLVRAGIDRHAYCGHCPPGRSAEPDDFAQALADLARGHALDTISLEGLNDLEVAALVGDRLGRGVDSGFAQPCTPRPEGTLFSSTNWSRISAIWVCSTMPLPTGRLRPRWSTLVLPWASATSLTVGSPNCPRWPAHALSVAAVAGSEFRAAEIATAMASNSTGSSPDWKRPHRGADHRDGPSAGCVPVRTRPGPPHPLQQYPGLASGPAALAPRRSSTSRAGRPELRLNELAYHYRLGLPAGDPQVAVPWLHQAGDQAVRQVAFEEAIEHYQAALDALDLCPDDPDRRYDQLAGLADAASAVYQISPGRIGPGWPQRTSLAPLQIPPASSGP